MLGYLSESSKITTKTLTEIQLQSQEFHISLQQNISEIETSTLDLKFQLNQTQNSLLRGQEEIMLKQVELGSWVTAVTHDIKDVATSQQDILSLQTHALELQAQLQLSQKKLLLQTEAHQLTAHQTQVMLENLKKDSAEAQAFVTSGLTAIQQGLHAILTIDYLLLAEWIHFSALFFYAALTFFCLALTSVFSTQAARLPSLGLVLGGVVFERTAGPVFQWCPPGAYMRGLIVFRWILAAAIIALIFYYSKRYQKRETICFLRHKETHFMLKELTRLRNIQHGSTVGRRAKVFQPRVLTEATKEELRSSAVGLITSYFKPNLKVDIPDGGEQGEIITSS